MQTTKIELTPDWQVIIDNFTDQNSDKHFQVSTGTGLFRYSSSTPTELDGMRLSAETTLFYVPVGAVIYGKLEIENDECVVFKNE